MDAVRAVDLSAWNHPEGQDIDFAEVAAAGYHLAYIKATQGCSYFSPWFARDMTRARAAGLWVGAFHFFTLDPVQDQLNWFLAHTPRLELPPAVDLEPYGDVDPSTVLGWPVLAQRASDLLRGLTTERGASVAYVDRNWRDGLAPFGFPWESKLWLAEGGASDPAPVEQIGTATVPGIPGDVDVDVVTQALGGDEPMAIYKDDQDEEIAFVFDCYVRFLGRPPEDLAVIAQWVDYLHTAGAAQTMAAFANSDEGKAHQAKRATALEYLAAQAQK